MGVSQPTLVNRVLALAREQRGILSITRGQNIQEKSGRKGVELINGKAGKLILRVYERRRSQEFFVRAPDHHATMVALITEFGKHGIKINPRS